VGQEREGRGRVAARRNRQAKSRLGRLGERREGEKEEGMGAGDGVHGRSALRGGREGGEEGRGREKEQAAAATGG